MTNNYFHLMFSIPSRCYDCKENLVRPDGTGQSVKLKCECIVGWCQVCAKIATAFLCIVSCIVQGVRKKVSAEAT